jgi:DNA invertase Pin-like site-specific DNA recombinase
MKQPKSKKSRELTAALYVRLSRDDNIDGESYSVGNQKKLLAKVAKEMGYANLRYFVDDGVSGVTMERPGFIEMIGEIENGKISAVFVKDMSRFGRNYLKVGYYTDEFLPEHDVRLVAVSDGIDTAEGENDFAPIKNLFNEWYSRDISKKRRISNNIRGNSGEPIYEPPYGYMKDPANPKRWLIDGEAAEVVRRIFSLSLNGMGTEQIATALTRDGILTPMYYWKKKGVRRPGRKTDRPPHFWNASTIVRILSMQEYCGDIINFKTYSKSYKDKTRRKNDPENWVIYKDVHEPVIKREVFEMIQVKRGKARKRKAKDGEKNMFSGLLVCADCGHNMHFHFNQRNNEIKYFNCSNYNNRKKYDGCDSTHHIRVDFLEQVVLFEIRRLMKFARDYENEFAEIVMGHSKNVIEFDRQRKAKDLKAMVSRYDEIDKLYEKMYEDNVNGKLPDERYYKMAKRYEDEQAELDEGIKRLKTELENCDDKEMTTDTFLATVRKYTRVRKLTPRMLNELIEKIEVHQAQKVDGEYEQELTIHYNCVGTIEIPSAAPQSGSNGIRFMTRKGVAVNYTGSQRAI